MTLRSSLTCSLAALAALALQTASAANLVQNPGFEQGPVSGGSYDWTFSPAVTGSDFNAQRNEAHSGTYAAGFGAVASGPTLDTLDTISQTLGTFAGHAYSISFWLETNEGDSRPDFGRFLAQFGGVTLMDQNPPSPLSSYTQYSFTEVATGPSTVLSFSGKSVAGWFALDDVDVEDLGRSSSVPDQGLGLWTVAGTLVGLCALSRRRASAQA